MTRPVLFISRAVQRPAGADRLGAVGYIVWDTLCHPERDPRQVGSREFVPRHEDALAGEGQAKEEAAGTGEGLSGRKKGRASQEFWNPRERVL